MKWRKTTNPINLEGKKNKLSWVILLSLLMMTTSSVTQSRMDRSRLNIGTYFLQPYASTEAHVRDLKACGIDFVVCMRNEPATLNLFSKYGVGAVVTGIVPGWWGGDGKNAGTMKEKNPMEKYDEAAKKFKDHPAIWGIDIGDEPSALDFPYYGKVMQHVDELFPNQFPYLNLYPNYASVSQNNDKETVNQLGTPTYEEHIAEYCRNVPADYLCYDFYLYSINVSRAYENLRVVSDACLGTRRSMWIVLQVNSNKEKEWITENELRFQAYTAMAFGAENIIWGCYTAGWWYNQVLDKNGQKTQQYDKLKRVNKEIRQLSDNYMRYRRTQTTFVGFDNTEWLKDVKQKGVKEMSNGIFENVKMTDDSPLVVGSMVSRSGDSSSAIFLCTAGDPYDKENGKLHELRFRADGRKVKATGVKGNIPIRADQQGFYTLKLPANTAVLIEAESK